jgi:hypothetical protein
MNQLELADKLKTHISVIYFASVVKVNQKIKGRNGNYSDEEKDMQKYKRLLDKVTKEIDKWHHDKKGRDLEKFERDDEYIEHEGSPVNFTSSDEGYNEESKNILDSPANLKIQFKTAFSDHGSPPNLRVKPQPGFKLSVMETVPSK